MSLHAAKGTGRTSHLKSLKETNYTNTKMLKFGKRRQIPYNLAPPPPVVRFLKLRSALPGSRLFLPFFGANASERFRLPAGKRERGGVTKK